MCCFGAPHTVDLAASSIDASLGRQCCSRHRPCCDSDGQECGLAAAHTVLDEARTCEAGWVCQRALPVAAPCSKG